MALVEQENIAVDESDLEARYAQIAAGNEDMIGRIKEFYAAQANAHNSMVAEIKEDKAITYLLEQAVVTEIATAELTAVTGE